MRRSSSLVIGTLLLLSYGLPISGQAAKSELVGEVRDQAGALVSRAEVTLTERATGQTFVGTTNEGNYTLTNSRPGVYNITVEASGCKQIAQDGVRLATVERVRLDFVLEPGPVTEVVTIHQDASLLRTESGSLGQVIRNRKIVDLPLNGRNFLSLVSLSAGVALPPPT